MNIQDFINRNNGAALDYDGAYGAQCVDLAQYWAKDLGTHTFTGNAIDIINQGNDGDYITVYNNPTNYPLPGDIVVWGSNDPRIGTGPYGHVDICVTADGNSLTTFDQNWVEVNAHVVSHHDYTGIIGWLHPRVLDAPAPQPEPAPEQSQPAPSPVETAPAPAPVTDTPQTDEQSSATVAVDPTPVTVLETPSTDPSLPENSTPVFTVKPVADSPKAQPLTKANLVNKLITLVEGKKTYIVATAIAVLNALIGAGYLSLSSGHLQAVNAVLAALGLGALRASKKN